MQPSEGRTRYSRSKYIKNCTYLPFLVEYLWNNRLQASQRVQDQGDAEQDQREEAAWSVLEVSAHPVHWYQANPVLSSRICAAGPAHYWWNSAFFYFRSAGNVFLYVLIYFSYLWNIYQISLFDVWCLPTSIIRIQSKKKKKSPNFSAHWNWSEFFTLSPMYRLWRVHFFLSKGTYLVGSQNPPQKLWPAYTYLFFTIQNRLHIILEYKKYPFFVSID